MFCKMENLSSQVLDINVSILKWDAHSIIHSGTIYGNEYNMEKTATTSTMLWPLQNEIDKQNDFKQLKLID